MDPDVEERKLGQKRAEIRLGLWFPGACDLFDRGPVGGCYITRVDAAAILEEFAQRLHGRCLAAVVGPDE